MKCPICGSNDADEINISVNTSYTEHDKPEVEYEGETYMGDCSGLIGTDCNSCCQSHYIPGFREIIIEHLKKSGVPW